MISSLEALDPEARAVVDACLARVSRGVAEEYRGEVIADLRTYFAEHLWPEATAADVAALAATVGETGEPAKAGARRGSFRGVPIDLTAPTAERIATTWWNPRDERIFVPRVFGLGWALNLGAVAVKLGLIEPDAEDEPFENAPAPALRKALIVPAGLAAAVVAHYVVRGPRLPETLPSNLDLAGRVASWTGKPVAAATDVAIAVAPTLWAAWIVGRGGTGARAAGAIASATAAAATAAGLSLWRAAAVDGKARPLAGPGLAALLWVPAGAVLLALARSGRAAEQRRDLGGAR